MTRVLRRTPFTAGFLVVYWTVALGTGSLLDGPATGLRHQVGVSVDSLDGQRWWSLLGSLLWTGNLPSYLGTSLVVSVLCGVAEYRWGTRLVAGGFVVTQVIGAVAAVEAIRLCAESHGWWADDLAGSVIVTPTGAAFGVAMLVSARCSALWRRRVRFGLVFVVMLAVLYRGSAADVLRLCTALSGLALGPVLLGRSTRDSPPVTRAQGRLMVSAMVAASALGPLLASISHDPQGPLAVLQSLLFADRSTPAQLRALCTDPVQTMMCRQQLAALRLSGPGAALMSVMPALVVLSMAEGLRRGRRLAWWGAVLCTAGLVLMGALLFTSYLSAFGRPGTVQDWIELSAPPAEPAGVLVLLLVTWRRFGVAAPPGVYRRFLRFVVTVAVGASAVFLLCGYALRGGFDESPSFGQLAAQLPSVFLPPGYLVPFPVQHLPHSIAAGLLYHWTGPVFWAAVICGCLATFARARVVRRDADSGRARELLARYGGTPLSHMITWQGNDYWFSDDGRTVIAYRVILGVALTTGEPVGPADERVAAAVAFTRFCADNGWTACFYAVTDDLCGPLIAVGWRTVQVAAEARLDARELEFRGRKWQDVRSAMNKATALGVRAELIDYRAAGPEIAGQVRDICRDWVSGKGIPELGFTLGSLAELDDPDVRCLIAVDAAGVVHGVTSWLPFRGGDGRIEGWTLDLMRRRADGFAGVMEFLIASMVVTARQEGAGMVSLSGTPLVNTAGPASRPVDKVLSVAGRVLEPVYRFRSLAAFKAKFQPRYLPLRLLYPDWAALPAIGNAVTRAYLPGATAGQYTRLLRAVVFRRRGSRRVADSLTRTERVGQEAVR